MQLPERKFGEFFFFPAISKVKGFLQPGGNMEHYMQFEEFVEYVRGEITGHLPLSMASGKVRIEPFRKIGSSYLSLTIDRKSACVRRS